MLEKLEYIMSSPRSHLLLFCHKPVLKIAFEKRARHELIIKS